MINLLVCFGFFPEKNSLKNKFNIIINIIIIIIINIKQHKKNILSYGHITQPQLLYIIPFVIIYHNLF